MGAYDNDEGISTNLKISTNKHKGKGFRSSLFPERLAGVKGAEPPCRPPQRAKSVCER